jgi:hypothetical protein
MWLFYYFQNVCWFLCWRVYTKNGVFVLFSKCLLVSMLVYLYEEMEVVLLFSKCSLVSMLVCLYEKNCFFYCFQNIHCFICCVYTKIWVSFYYFQNVRWFECWCVYTKIWGFPIIFKMFVGFYVGVSIRKNGVLLLLSKCSLVSMLVYLYENMGFSYYFQNVRWFLSWCVYTKKWRLFYYFQNVFWFLCWCVYTKNGDLFLLFSKCSLVSMLVYLYEKMGVFFYCFQNVRWFLCWCVYTKIFLSIVFKMFVGFYIGVSKRKSTDKLSRLQPLP